LGDGGDEDTGLPLDLGGSFDESIAVTASSRFSAASSKLRKSPLRGLDLAIENLPPVIVKR
jgi:hypothetical protein